MRSSRPFTVRGPEKTLHVAAGSTGTFIGGLVLVGAGGGLVIGGAMWSAFHTLVTGRSENGLMYVAIGTGAALAIVGGALLLSSSTTVRSSTPLVAGLRLTPNGIEF